MKIIGITGGICSGKSEVSKFLLDHKCEVIDCDRISHLLYAQDWFVEGLCKLFGSVILTDGKFDKTKLRKLVFSSETSLDKLNKYCHKHIFNIVKKDLGIYKISNIPVVFIDAPVLFESSMDKEIDFDEIIVVSASRETQIERLKLRNPDLTETEISGILDAQMSADEREHRGTIVIDNNGTKEDLYKAINQVTLRIKLVDDTNVSDKRAANLIDTIRDRYAKELSAEEQDALILASNRLRESY